MAAITLTPGFQVLAFKLQEASMMHSDVASRLSDAVNTAHQGSGTYGHYIDHDGDGESGNVVYSSNGDIRQAPYEIGTKNGKASAGIDTDSSKSVVPVTTYQPGCDDSDHYTSMESLNLYSKLPLYERFIPKKTRDAADASSFAGKGRSFPILKAADVSAALHSIGRAGSDNYSSDTLRSNIKRIATAKGFALPDSLKSGMEGSTWKPDGILLTESACFQELPALVESAPADYPIKLISPGRGSSGYYPPEVLKKAAEAKVFKAGTQMFWNHDTDAEESARPEGDLNRLAAVTTTDAAWNENGHDGPGLYARAKVFGEYAQKVKEMGPHIGLSIRAGGDRDESAKGPDGKPRVITALKNAASVDFVTKAGRDGKIFTESATHEGEDMDEAQILRLIERANAPLIAENKRLSERLAMAQAPGIIREALKDTPLPDASKNKIIRRLAESDISATIADPAKLKTLIESEVAAERQFLIDLGYQPNAAAMGTSFTEAEVRADMADFEKTRDKIAEGLADIFVGKKLKTATPDKMARRDEAREAFTKGRAA